VVWGDDDVADFLATIEDETDRLTALVENLLDLGRVQAGALELNLRAVHLDEVVPAAIASLGARASAVKTDVPEDLPAVVADPALLERVIANLVENGSKWSPPGALVVVQAGAVGSQVHVRVVDRGPGIPQRSREAVFEPFQRLGDTTRGGVGLGLALARGFVVAMGGDLELEDTPGGGTTAVVRLEASA
jgi:two-component system sensor histidine kinase KdpD